MTVYLVGAGPGDPGLITRRAMELLSSADVVVYDRLIDTGLLALARPGAELVDVGKRSGQPGGRSSAARQAEIHQVLERHGSDGRTVVRLKGGDPFLFGRGGEEAEALAAAGIPFEVVPGVTSAFAAPAYAGIPVTHRGRATSVTVVTGHVGDPTAPGGVDWESLARAGGTLVVLMGMATRGEIARRLVAGGRPAATPVAVVEWGTTPSQRVQRTTLDGLSSVTLGSPAVIVIGPVAALDLSWLQPSELNGVAVALTRPRGQSDEWREVLEGAGARVVEVPLITIVDPDDGGAAAAEAAQAAGAIGAIGAVPGGYDWVVFTSANAVDRFLDQVPDLRALAGTRLAAVGAATARALTRRHLVADLVPERAGAEGLVAAFADRAALDDRADQGIGGGGRVLYPRAADVGPTLAQGLQEQGWTVDEVITYRTVAVPGPDDRLAAALGDVDVVVFASPSAVRAYLGVLDGPGGPDDPLPVVACIGPSTAAAAREAGLEVVIELDRPSPDALVAALRRLAARPPGADHGLP